MRSFRVDQPSPTSAESGSAGSIVGGRSTGVGLGPVGPLFVGMAWLLHRRKKLD